MKPISVRNFLRHNPIHSLPMLVLLIGQIGIIVFIISIGMALIDGAEFASLSWKDKIILATPSEKIKNLSEVENLKEQTKNIPGVKDLVEVDFVNIQSKMIFFQSGSVPFLGVGNNQQEAVMKHLGISLVEGRLPKNSKEIVLTTENMNFSKGKIGDWIGKSYQDSLELRGDYLVVGRLESPYNIAITSKSEAPGAWLLLTKDNQQSVVEKQLKEHQNPYGFIWGPSEAITFLQTIRGMIQLLGGIFLGALTLALWISFQNMMKNEIFSRAGELSLLRALGYQHKEVRKLLMKQTWVQLLLGYGIGVLLGLAVNYVFDQLYCFPKGIPYEVLHSNYLYLSGLMVLVLGVISLWEVDKQLRRMDWMKEMYSL